MVSEETGIDLDVNKEGITPKGCESAGVKMKQLATNLKGGIQLLLLNLLF